MEFKKRLGECLNFIPKDLERIAYFPFLGDQAGIKKYLVENDISPMKRFKIQSFYRQARYIEKEKDSIIELLTYGLSDDRFSDPFQRLEYKEKIERIGEDFWKNLFSLNLAMASKNHPWLTQLIKNLGQTSPYFFEVYGPSFSESERKMVRDYILELIEKVKDRTDDELRIKVLARKVSQLGKTEDFQEIADELDAQWSLSELRDLFQNPLWKNEYFDFWYSLIKERTTQAEVDSKLRSVLTGSLVSSAHFSQLWVFDSYLPANKKVRKVLYSRLEEKWSKGDMLDTYQILELLKMAPIKSAMSKKVSDLNRANFQLTREFFIRLLNSGRSSQFALYQLYRLGDKDSDHLWWLVL